MTRMICRRLWGMTRRHSRKTNVAKKWYTTVACVDYVMPHNLCQSVDRNTSSSSTRLHRRKRGARCPSGRWEVFRQASEHPPRRRMYVNSRPSEDSVRATGLHDGDANELRATLWESEGHPRTGAGGYETAAAKVRCGGRDSPSTNHCHHHMSPWPQRSCNLKHRYEDVLHLLRRQSTAPRRRELGGR